MEEASQKSNLRHRSRSPDLTGNTKRTRSNNNSRILEEDGSSSSSSPQDSHRNHKSRSRKSRRGSNDMDSSRHSQKSNRHHHSSSPDLTGRDKTSQTPRDSKSHNRRAKSKDLARAQSSRAVLSSTDSHHPRHRSLSPDLLSLDGENVGHNNRHRKSSRKGGGRRTKSMDMTEMSLDENNNDDHLSKSSRSKGRRTKSMDLVRSQSSRAVLSSTSASHRHRSRSAALMPLDEHDGGHNHHQRKSSRKGDGGRRTKSMDRTEISEKTKSSRHSSRASKPGAQSINGSTRSTYSRNKESRKGHSMDGSHRSMNYSSTSFSPADNDDDDDSDSSSSENPSISLSAREIADARIKARAAASSSSSGSGNNNAKPKRSKRALAPGAQSIHRSSRRNPKRVAMDGSVRSNNNSHDDDDSDLDDSDHDGSEPLSPREIADARIKARAGTPGNNTKQHRSSKRATKPGVESMDGHHLADQRLSAKERRSLARSASMGGSTFSKHAPRKTKSMDEQEFRIPQRRSRDRSHKPGAIPNNSKPAENEVLVEAVTIDEEEARVQSSAPSLAPQQPQVLPPVISSAPSAELNNNNLHHQEEAQVDKSGSKKRRNIIVVVILIVAGIVGGFLLGGGSSARDSKSNEASVPTDDSPSNAPTASSSSLPTVSLSESPTNDKQVLLFDPPSPEDCTFVRLRQPVSGQDDMITKSFNLYLDVTLQMEITDISTWLNPLLSAMEEYLVPVLVGCLVKQEKNQRRLQLQGGLLDYRYAIANAYASGVAPDYFSCTDDAEPPCRRAVVELELFLKGSVSVANLYTLLLTVIESDWGGNSETNHSNNRRQLQILSLEEKLALPKELVKKVSLVQLYSLDPTEIPSSEPSNQPTTPMPSDAPSSAPSKYPSIAPTRAPNPTPTSAPNPMPVTNQPTPVPSLRPTTVSPTKLPTPVPTPGPTPPPSPGPTNPPTPGPSRTPTTSPSLNPSSLPSTFPSIGPTVAPSPEPSHVPSGAPSACDLCIGWEACDPIYVSVEGIICNSCIGSRACNRANTPISSDSCNGDQACNRVDIGSPIVNSCNGERTCDFKFWESIGEESCNCDFCCSCMPHTAVIEDNSCNNPDDCCTSAGGSLDVGEDSCIGEDVCVYQMGSVGNNSCQGRYACEQTWLDIADGSCIGDHSCRMSNVDSSWPEIATIGFVGPNSCIGSRACYSKQWGFSAGENSCNGDDACMATWYQQEMYVGSNSCNCDNCCKCFGGSATIPDNSCNELAPDETAIDFVDGGTGPYQYCCTAPE